MEVEPVQPVLTKRQKKNQKHRLNAAGRRPEAKTKMIDLPTPEKKPRRAALARTPQTATPATPAPPAPVSEVSELVGNNLTNAVPKFSK